MEKEIERIREQFGFSKEHPVFDREDWKHEVFCDDTVLGYWEWVVHQIESNG